MRKMITGTNEKELQDLIEYGGVIIDTTPIRIEVDITGDGSTDNNNVIISKTITELRFDFSYFYGKNISINIDVGTNTLDTIFILPTYCDFNVENASSNNIFLEVNKFNSPIFLVNDTSDNSLTILNSIPSGIVIYGFTDGRFSFFYKESL